MRRGMWSRIEMVALLAGLAWWSGCGGGAERPTPIPTATPLPEPTATPTPVPTPTPTPTPCPACEPNVTNTNPPVRLNLRLYAVEDPYGETKFSYDPDRGIPLDWVARLDVVGKDADGQETNGRDTIEFHFSAPKLVKVSGAHSHQRRLKALDTGELTCWAIQQGVRSNDLVLRFVP